MHRALRRLGGDARITTGDFRVAQRWALALWQHPQTPDGLYWRSRFDNDRYCVALFDRCRGAIEARSLGTLDAAPNRALLGAILETYDFALV